MIYNKCVFYDMGHGGLDILTDKYTTAPDKMFKHKQGIFHREGEFYEGVKNRFYGYLVIQKLIAQGVNVIPVCHSYKDTSLSKRVALANYYHDNIQKGIYISEHSDATPKHNAKGFSVWTSPGRTSSDRYADLLLADYKRKFEKEGSKIQVREDRRDGDSDYEAKFFVLVKTKMPAVLIENLFFDHYEDATILMDSKYIDEYTTLQANWIIKCLCL